jgi:O-antigen/teichoic acid export membrane protein
MTTNDGLNSKMAPVAPKDPSAIPFPERRSLKRNTLYNLTGSLFSMATALITVPLFIHKIGTEKYGVLAIIWLFISYFGVLDLGLSRATANQIAKLSDVKDRSDVFWTAILLNAVIGVLGGFALYLLGGFLVRSVLRMPASMRDSTIVMMPWLAIAAPVTTITGVLTGAMEGCERFLLVNSLQVCGSIFLQVIPLTVAFLVGPDLEWLIGAAIIARIITTVPFFIGIFRILPVGQPRLPSSKWARVLFGYGVWVTLSNIVAPIFNSVDKFMIGGIAGLSSVTYYAVPERLARQASVFPGALARTLFPRLSAGHHLDAKETARRSLIALIAVLTPVTIVMVLGIRPFLTHWIDPKFAIMAGPVGAVIAVSIWINGLAFVPYALLDARGRPDLTAKFHLIEIVPHLILLWYGLRQFGLVGGAWALVFVSALDAGLLFWKSDLQVHRLASFWLAVGWVAISFLFAPAYAVLHAWFYCLALIVFVGATRWALRASEDVSTVVKAGLRRLRWNIQSTESAQ